MKSLLLEMLFLLNVFRNCCSNNVGSVILVHVVWSSNSKFHVTSFYIVSTFQVYHVKEPELNKMSIDDAIVTRIVAKDYVA